MKNIIKYFAIMAIMSVVFIAPRFSSAATTEEIQAQINALMEQIRQLQTQLAQTQSQPAQWCHDFNTNLRAEDRGEEVAALYMVMEKEGLALAAGDYIQEKPKNYFGESLASVVVSFQQKYKDEILSPFGLKYGTGFVGKGTRAKLNKLYGCGAGSAQIAIPVQIPVTTAPTIEKPISIQPPATLKPVIPPSAVAEQVKCVFKDSINEQKCYSTVPSSGVQYACGGISSCTADVKGAKGEQISWKSSCGGYAPTIIDGNSEYVYFNCGSSVTPITLNSPNGGENWIKGETRNIAWTGGAQDLKNEIRLINADNLPTLDPIIGYSYYVLKLASNLSGATNSFSWMVGNIDCPSCATANQGIPAGKYTIRIIDSNKNYDSSDATFNIVSNTGILAPSGQYSASILENMKVTLDQIQKAINDWKN